jgi:PPOX class probable F420-dependent enzyme
MPLDALTRFQSARVAHLATTDTDGRPHIVPVTFAAWSNTVIMAIDHKPKTTTNLKRLRNIAANPRVSLLADEYNDADWTRLWWVRVDGTAHVVEKEPTRTQLAARLIEKYEQYRQTPPTGPVIQVRIEAVQSWTYS